MRTNQSLETKEADMVNVNFTSKPDTAELANERLEKCGRVGKLVVELTRPFDKAVDSGFATSGKTSRKSK